VALLLRYYKDLFKSSMPTQIDEAIAHVTPVVTQAMNEDLTRVFTAGEVNFALKQIGPLTAPGPDGMPPLFY
jgi:hypothetical protein